MSSPQVFHPLPFLHSHRIIPSRSSSALGEANRQQTFGAPYGTSLNGSVTGPNSAESDSSFAGSQHEDHGYDPVIPGDFEGLPASSPHDNHLDLGSSADNNPAARNGSSTDVQVKQEDGGVFSASALEGNVKEVQAYAPFAISSSNPINIPGGGGQHSKWGQVNFSYQTSATRGSMPPPSSDPNSMNAHSASDGETEYHGSKISYILPSSMDSAYGGDQPGDRIGQRDERPQIQVQIGSGSRPSYQPSNSRSHSLTAPYASSFNPKVRPLHSFSSPRQEGTQRLNFLAGPGSQDNQQQSQQSQQYSGRSLERSVPPLSSSSTATATTSASLHTSGFPGHDQRTPTVAMGPPNSSYQSHSLPPSYLPSVGEQIIHEEKESQRGDCGSNYSLPRSDHFSSSIPFSFGGNHVWREGSSVETASSTTPIPHLMAGPGSSRQLSSTPQPIQPPGIGPFSFGLPHNWHPGMSISDTGNGMGQPGSQWRSNGTSDDDLQSVMPKGFPKSPRKHVCRICDKRFNRPSSLQTHMSVHTGAKPYQCPKAECGRRFSVSSNLRRHMRTHEAKARKEPKDSQQRREYETDQDDELQDENRGEGVQLGGGDISNGRYSQPAYPFYFPPQQPGTNSNNQSQQQQQEPENQLPSQSYFGGYAYNQPGMQTPDGAQQQHGSSIYSNSQNGTSPLSTNSSNRPPSTSNRSQHSLMLGPSIPQGSRGYSAIASPFSNKQHGVRQGPSIFGYNGGSPSQVNQGRPRQDAQ